MRYAVINKDNIVVTVIIWDGISNWTPPDGCFVIQNDRVDSGDIYDPNTNTFSKPSPHAP